MSELQTIFDNCTWTNKHLDSYPELVDEIRYAWREDEADYARLFLKEGVLKEETPALNRSLYLGNDPNGVRLLCVREQTLAYSGEAIAKKFVDMMNVDKVLDAYAAAGFKPSED